MKLANYRKQIKFIFLILFTFQILTLNIFCQISYNSIPYNSKTARYSFQEIWTREQNIPLSAINSIVQTREGYIWFGTGNGLVRYDGIRFLHFNQKNTKELLFNNINVLLVDHNNTLWIGTSKGLLQYKNNKFSSPYNIGELKGLTILSLYEDKEGIIWIGVNIEGIFYIKNDSLFHYNPSIRDAIWQIYQHADSSIYFCTNDLGIFKLKNNTLEIISQKYNIPKIRNRAILFDGIERFWIGTYGNGLFRYDNGTLRNYNISNGFPSNAIPKIFKDSKNNIWFCTLGGGLIVYKNNKFTFYNNKDGLSNDVIKSIYEDKEENLWIGTAGGGLNRLKRNILTTYTSRDGLSNNFIWSTYEDRKGNLWIGTNGGGVDKIGETGIKNISTKNGLSSDVIRSIYCDKDNNIWIGTYNGGLNIIKDGKIKIYSKKSGFLDDCIKSIFEDSEGTIWIATPAGFIKYKNKKFIQYTQFSLKMPGYNTKCFCEDKDKNLWIGTGSGLSKFKDTIIKSFTRKEGLSSADILSLYSDEDNIVWAGTSDGLNRIENNKITAFTVFEGLPHNMIYNILEDEKGNLWMGCDIGIIVVSKNDLNKYSEGKIKSVFFTLLNKDDGMMSIECNGGNQPSSCKTRVGRLLFPTMHGVVMVDPERLDFPKSSIPPTVVINNLFIDNIPAPISENIQIPAGTNRLGFQYSALSFINPEKNQYKYILEGFDKDWNYSGNISSVSYTNVPPGYYTFKVIACNSNQVWNQTGTSLSFYLKPYFYQTFWFYLILAIIVFVMISGGYILRIRQIRKREKELVALVEQRTTELRELNIKKDKFFSIISHDMKNLFSSLLNFSEILHRDYKILDNDQILRFIEYIDLATKAFFNLLCNLLDWARIQTGKMNFIPEKISIHSSVKNLFDLLLESAKEKSISLINETDENHLVFVDRNALNSVLQNLIINSIKFTMHNGIIKVSSKNCNENLLAITVTDTGIGIPEDNIKDLFKIDAKVSTAGTDDEIGTGLGLILIKELVEKSGGNISVESKIGEGSSFTFTLPKSE